VNSASAPARLRRLAATLTVFALAALGSIAGVAPAAAATGDVTGGTATWGISTYLNAGTFGRPSPLAAQYTAPASYDATSKLSTWGNGSGRVNADGSATLAFEGTSVNFTATGGGWLKLANLQATLDAAGNGTVTALVSYGQAPGTYPNISFDPAQAPLRGPERVAIVTLAGNSASATLGTGTASWSGLAGTWSSDLLAYLQGDGPDIPAWGYAATITNDASVAGPRTALPFAFSVTTETPSYTASSYNSGTASWGLSTYLNAGTFGRPSPLASAFTAPASYSSATKLTTWGNGSGTVSADGSATLAFEGTSVNFTATGGGWLTLADLQATLDPSGNGEVTALVSYGQAPGTYPNIAFDPEQAPLRGPERVAIVTLAGNSAAPTQSTGAVSWANLAGTWSSELLDFLQGDGAGIPAWGYAATITNDASVAGPRTALPFSFSLGTVPLTATATTLSVSPSGQALAGSAVTLSSTVTPAVAGSVEFRNGSSTLATVPVASGAASYTIPSAAAGEYTLTATFVPQDALRYAGSTSTAVSYVVSAPVVAKPGSLTWGVKQSLQSYVLGGGAIGTAGGAGFTGAQFSFPQTSTTGFDHASGTGSSSYGGTVTFSYPAHGFSIVLSKPRVRLTSATSGVLYLDVTGPGTSSAGVAFANLSLGSATRSTTGTSTTVSNVSATLTAAGATAFGGFYSAGTALDPLSFVVGSPSAGFAATTTSSAATPDATPPATEGISAGSQPAVAGAPFTAVASGFQPGEQGILVVLYSEPRLLGSISADANGIARWDGALPEDLTGIHTLTFQGSVDRGVVLEIAEARTAATAMRGCPVTDAVLSWGFKESFRSYLSSSIANGEWTVADGASYETPTFGFSDGVGSYDPLGASQLDFAGSITFTGHEGILNTTVANPSVRFDNASTATLLLDVIGTTQQGEVVSALDVEFVTLDLAAAAIESSGGVVTISDAPAVLTEAGAAAFGTYGAGEAFDPLTVVFTVGDCAVEVPEAPAADEPVASDAADLGWLPWAIIALLVISGVITTVVVLRRRAQK
jgi:hypothetical protein